MLEYLFQNLTGSSFSLKKGNSKNIFGRSHVLPGMKTIKFLDKLFHKLHVNTVIFMACGC